MSSTLLLGDSRELLAAMERNGAGRVDERWMHIPGWDGFYSVSNLGKIKSLGRIVVRRNGARFRVCERTLSPSVDKDGYLSVSLKCPGRRDDWYVHRAVLFAFRGPPPPGAECCHGPNGPSDNRLSQLRWGTRQVDQMDDRERDGTHPRGQIHGMSKISEGQAAEVWSRAWSGELQKDIASEFGISQSQVSRIKNCKGWRHIEHAASVAPETNRAEYVPPKKKQLGLF